MNRRINGRTKEGKNRLYSTYMDEIFIFVVDKPIVEHSQAFVAPHAHKLLGRLEPIGSGQTQSVCDPGQIAQVEDVVEFGRCRR